MLYFNVRDSPNLLLDKVIDIKVFNTKLLVVESLIGSFKFDIGIVYDEPGMLIVLIGFK